MPREETRRFRIAFGPIFQGWVDRVDPTILDRGMTNDACGVICSDGGIKRAAGLVRVTDFALPTPSCVTMNGTGWIQVANGSATFPYFGRRWTILMAFNPTAIAGTQYLLAQRRTIGGSDYYAPAIILNSDGTLTLKWTTSDETDKSDSSSLTVSDGETWFLLARRIDDAFHVYLASASTAPALWISKVGLGVDDFPEDSGVHHLQIGADGDQGNGFVGGLDGLTMLETGVQELDYFGMEWPMPLLETVRLHLPLDEAAGSEFTDRSAYADDYTITHSEANVTHQGTALVYTPGAVQFLGQTRAGAERYANTIYRGGLYSSRLNV